MREQSWKRLAGRFVLSGLMLTAGMSAIIAWAQNPAPPAGTKVTVKESTTAKAAPTAKEAAPAKKVAKKPAGRLPVFYADIVSEEQKAKIYAIQGTYADKLSALTEQIKAIQAQQNAEIEGVLSEEQLQKLQVAKEAAAEKRKQRAAAAASAATPKKVATE